MPKKHKTKTPKTVAMKNASSPRNSGQVDTSDLPAPLEPSQVDGASASTQKRVSSESLASLHAVLPPIPSSASQPASLSTQSGGVVASLPDPLPVAMVDPLLGGNVSGSGVSQEVAKSDLLLSSSGSRGSVVIQRRRNNPLQKPVGWNFAPAESLDPKVHSKHAKRQNIALEISSTESSYVSSLKHLYDEFVVPVSVFLSASEVAMMFGNLSEILSLHTDFAREIYERVNHWNYSTLISDIFLQYVPKMVIYSGFINTYEKGVALIAELSSQKGSKYGELSMAFSALPASHGLDMPAFRINPVQRLPRLCLLLEDLLRNTIENHPDYPGIRDALAKLRQVSLAVNAAKGAALMQEHFESIAKRLNNGWQTGTSKACKSPLINENRHLIIEDTPMLLLGPTQKIPVSLALFNDGILVAKRNFTSEQELFASFTSKNAYSRTEKLEFIEWLPLRVTRLRKIGTKQVQKISKDWKVAFADHVESFQWLEVQVDEKETFLLGVSELKFWHDWPTKFRAALTDMRSKYWSVIDGNSSSGSASGSGGASSLAKMSTGAQPQQQFQNHPPPCAYGTLTYVPALSAFVYFGGISNKLLNAFHMYNLQRRQWVEIACVGGPPPALAKHSASLVGSKIWYYGGLVKNTVTVSNELFTYDVHTNTWAGPIATEGDIPTRGRAGHTMTQVGTKLYLFGGATFDEKKQEVILDDMYEFDTTTLKWTVLNKSPVARHGHVAAALGDTGKLYVWGGRSPGGEYSSTLSVYDFAVRDWTEALNITGFVPTPRQWAAGAPVQDRHLLVIGGKRDALQNDVYLLDVNAETWCKYSIPCVLDHRMSAAIQVIENPRSKILTVYLFGGLQLNAETMDTTIYSDQFITFQLHNKYIQQTAKPKLWTSLRNFAIDDHTSGAFPSSASSARFNFVSKVAQPTGTHVAKAESTSALCNLQLQLSADSRFGETWMAVHARTHISFAVKVMKKPVQRDVSEEWKQMMKSLEAAQKIKSPALTSYLGILDQPDTESFWLLSEYCKHGSVKDYIAVPGNKLRETQLQFLATIIVSALQALHSAGLVHGDLRASNILLNDSLEFKVSDFGIASSLDSLLKPTLAWQPWDAPELLLGGSTTPKSDVYALGVTLIEMAEFSLLPSRSSSASPNTLQHLTKGKWSSNMEDFVNRCTAENANLRADLEALAAHPWLKTAKISEKLQLDLADAIKKGYAKEAKKRTATLSASLLHTSQTASTASSSASPSSPKSSPSPSSGKTAKGTNTTAEDDPEEIETLRSKNAVLRKKLRLLKKAYAELGQENAKLKEQLDQLTSTSETTGTPPNAASPLADSESSLNSPTLDKSSSSGSLKVKRSSTKLSASTSEGTRDSPSASPSSSPSASTHKAEEGSHQATSGGTKDVQELMSTRSKKSRQSSLNFCEISRALSQLH